MKKLCAMLLCLLLTVCAACAQEAAVDYEALLTVTVNGVDYRLGVTTAEDIAADGWRMEIEADGVFAFYSPENESWFYAVTQDGASYLPIVSIDLMWADGIPTVYCGFAEPAEDDVPGSLTLWDWLTDAFGAEMNEEGTLAARVPLPEGGALLIETKDVRVRLTLTD